MPLRASQNTGTSALTNVLANEYATMIVFELDRVYFSPSGTLSIVFELNPSQASSACSLFVEFEGGSSADFDNTVTGTNIAVGTNQIVGGGFVNPDYL